MEFIFLGQEILFSSRRKFFLLAKEFSVPLLSNIMPSNHQGKNILKMPKIWRFLMT